MIDPLYSGGSFGEVLISALQRFPDRIAFEEEGGRSVTYRETARQIGRAIARLRALGLQPGDTVVQLSGNRSETFFVMAALYIGGFRSVTLHTLASVDDQAYIIEDAEAALVIVDPRYRDRALQLRERLSAARPERGALQWFAHEAVEGFGSFWVGDEIAPLSCVGGPEHIIRLAYTGGTTGKPKGVMLSNRSMTTNVVLALAGKAWPETVRFLCPTPITHGAGAMILPTLHHGGTFILQQGFDRDRVLDAIADRGVTSLFLVPTMIYTLLDHPRTRTIDFSRLHSLMYGAAPMTPARIREAIEVFGPVLVQGYGQTEAPNTLLTLTREDHLSPDERRLASAGRPYPGITLAVLDDQDQPVAQGEVGEICVRGSLVMTGYWKQPEQTAEALRNGWLHTGDMAWQDEQGYYYIVDRKKDMIISGGFNVYPKEIENVLATHPAVASVAVIGVPDPKWGEAVKAVVVLRPGAQAGEAELIALARDRKGPVAAPKSVDFVDSLPVTALGKPDKKVLRARYWGGLQRAVH
jgi:fatty-acyl-CoA synthase